MARVEYGMRKLPVCEQQRRACVMNSGGKCVALYDTIFNRPCPFYKTKAMLKAEGRGDKRW